MKIALAQLNYHIGNFEGNINKIKNAIKKAKSESADLIVFAELAVCGYPPRDFLEYSEFIKFCDEAVHSVASECDGIAAIIGAPSVNTGKGKSLFNSAYFLSEGKIAHISNKSLLPNYDVFDEYRYFEPGTSFNIIHFKEYKIALTICEDIWTFDERVLYTVCPMDELKKQKPDFIINIAASPFSLSQNEKRKKTLKSNALNYQLPLFYVNHCGAQTELIFDGNSLAMDEKGNIVDELNCFEEDFKIFEINKNESGGVVFNHLKYEKQNSKSKTTKIENIHDALITGIRDYFSKSGLKQAAIGLSGGIDSAVVCVLAAKALGNKNVRAILMPSEFSSEGSVNDAIALAVNLDVSHDIIPIHLVYNAFNNTLKSTFNNLPFNIAEENLQARSRGVILMGISNKFGNIVLNTSNKSEMAVGYGTLYGDMCGGLSVIGDVYKTEIYELAHFINRKNEIIPQNIINKPPSAELRPDQKDSDSLPEYDILDKILFQYIEKCKGENELIAMGFDKTLVKRILHMVNFNEYKRIQAPPILRVSEKAFGMGRRMPVVGKY